MIRKKWWFFTIFVLIMVNKNDVFGLSHKSQVLLLELFFVTIVFLAIIWADSYEPEPSSVVVWSMLWGAGPVVLFVTTIYELLPSFGERPILIATLEEGMKLTILLMPINLGLVDSWTDGFVYGALCGLGFSFSEDILYASGSVDDTKIIIFRGLQSIFAHSVFSGIFAGLLITGLKTKRHLLVLIGLLSGILLHAGWDSLVEFATYGQVAALGVITPAVFFGFAIWLRDWEKQRLEEMGRLAVAKGILTFEEVNYVCDLRSRKIAKQSLQSKKLQKDFELSTIANARILLCLDSANPDSIKSSM